MHDRYDDRGVPISSGIPPIIFIAGIVGLCVIATMVTIVFTNSAVGHAWPSDKSLAVPLQ